MVQSPDTQLDLIRQALSQDKRAIGFLLGAGCPLAIRVRAEEGSVDEPLIPALAGLTRIITEELASGGEESLVAIQEHLTDAKGSEPTIEELLTHIRLLQQIVGKGEVFSLTRRDLDALEIQICGAVVEQVSKDLPHRNTPYHQLAQWIATIPRDKPVHVFTTNYDLLIEQALEDEGVPYFDGFVGSRNPRFDAQTIERDDLPDRWVRLWKLHGSINWQATGAEVRRGTDGPPTLIYPSYRKYEESRRMPYLVLMDKLRAFLGQPGALILTCGYSFGDQHINEVIAEALRVNPRASVFGCLYGELDVYASARTIAEDVANLVLLASDRGMIGTREVEWGSETGTKDDVSEGTAAKMQLGDFAFLGRFIAGIAGDRRGVNGAV